MRAQSGPRERDNVMATKDAEWTESTAGAAANDGWNEVDAESQIVLENEGDGWIGQFLGMDAPNANGIVQAHFERVTGLDNTPLGDGMFINAGKDLQNKLKNVPANSQVRIEWTSSMNTGQKSPMRVFSVKWR